MKYCPRFMMTQNNTFTPSILEYTRVVNLIAHQKIRNNNERNRIQTVIALTIYVVLVTADAKTIDHTKSPTKTEIVLRFTILTLIRSFHRHCNASGSDSLGKLFECKSKCNFEQRKRCMKVNRI